MRKQAALLGALLVAAAPVFAATPHHAHKHIAATAPAHHPRANLAVEPVSRMSEHWWRARFEAKQAELAARHPALLWIGDSITQNWESDGPQPFRRFLPIWQRFYGDRNAVDLGFKGDSTCHLLWRIDHGELDGIAPRGVVLLIGANNFGHVHTDAAQTYAGIVAVVDRIHAKLPNTKILLLGVLPSIRSAWVTENTDAVNRMMASEIRNGRPYLTYRDVGDLFRENGKVQASDFIDPLLTPPDPPLHPTPAMQERIAAAIEPDVAAMVGDTPHH